MKHIKSTAHDVMALFDRDLTVAQIAEPLLAFDEQTPASEARKEMEAREFDVAGVRSAGVVLGYVTRADLTRGTCGAHMQVLDPRVLIADSTPLLTALKKLAQQPRLFVMQGDHVGAIVCKGDVQKIPVRLWLFGIISLLEMHLLRVIKLRHAETWQEYLAPERLAAAQALYRTRVARGVDIDLPDCLQFCDKRDIVMQSAPLRHELPITSKRRTTTLLMRAEAIRNDIAHAQSITNYWPDVVGVAADIIALLQQCERIT